MQRARWCKRACYVCYDKLTITVVLLARLTPCPFSAVERIGQSEFKNKRRANTEAKYKSRINCSEFQAKETKDANSATCRKHANAGHGTRNRTRPQRYMPLKVCGMKISTVLV